MKLRFLVPALFALASPAFAQLPTPNLSCSFKINGTVVGCPAAVAVGGTGGSTAAGARSALGAAASGANSDITSLSSLSTALSIGQGGTGSGTAAGARTNLGVTATGADTAYAFRANNLSDLVSASTARTNLGLGSLAILSTINNLNWSGTALAVANGGTGTTTAGATAAGNIGALAVSNNLSDLNSASTARTNLGLGTLATSSIRIAFFGGNSGTSTIAGGNTAFVTQALMQLGSSGSAEAIVYQTYPVAGTAKNMAIFTPGAPGVGQTYTFTLRNAIADTVITCTISGNASNTCSDTTHTVSAAQFDRWSVKVVTSATAATLQNVIFAFEYDF